MLNLRRDGRRAKLLSERANPLLPLYYVYSSRRIYSAQSTATNKARLKLLQAREQHLQELFDKAREQIVHFSEERGRYEQLLQSVIVQVRLVAPPHNCLES